MGKKQKRDIEVNGLPFKEICRYTSGGEVMDCMWKPKLGLIGPNVHVSGPHRLQFQQEEDHYDHYYQNKEWVERKNLEFPFFISGGSIF